MPRSRCAAEHAKDVYEVSLVLSKRDSLRWGGLLLQARGTVILPYEVYQCDQASATEDAFGTERGGRLGKILYIRDSDNDADSDEDPDDDLDI